MSRQRSRRTNDASSPGVLICDLARPAGYDTAPPMLRAAFDQALQVSEDARQAYAQAVQDAGGHRGRQVRFLFKKYTATIEPLGKSRAALTDPNAAVLHEAVEALLSIGAWGLHDSQRAEVWTLAMQARRAIDGNPMSSEEAERFRASIPARYHDSTQPAWPHGHLRAGLAREVTGLDRFGRIRQHISEAVLHQMQQWDGPPDAWRNADPHAIAAAAAIYAMAAIGPVIDSEVVATGVAVMRGMLNRAGLDPQDLPWFETEAGPRPPGGTREGEYRS